MKRLLILGIIGISLALIYLYPRMMLNPGSLSEGHQKIMNDCNACHQPFWGIATDKCIICHKLAEIGKDDSLPNATSNLNKRILFHSGLANQSCTSCHTDHKGLKPTLQTGSFNHDMLPITDKNNCAGCHPKPIDKIHASISMSCNACHNYKGWKNAVSFNHDQLQVADKNNCISCHPKPTAANHQAFEGNCSQCHSTSKWLPASFEHSSYFQLDGNHNAKCEVCHTNNNYKQYTCYGCHEHSESNLRGEHNEHGIYELNNCISCHKSGSEHEGGERGEGGEKGGREDDDD